MSAPLEHYRQIDTDAAAEWLSLSTRMLEKLRQTGNGPRFVRISHKCVRYRIVDLIAWQETHIAANTITYPAH